MFVKDVICMDYSNGYLLKIKLIFNLNEVSNLIVFFWLVIINLLINDYEKGLKFEINGNVYYNL